MADLDGSDASPPESQGEFPVAEKLSLQTLDTKQLFKSCFSHAANAGGWSALKFAGTGAVTLNYPRLKPTGASSGHGSGINYQPFSRSSIFILRYCSWFTRGI